MTHPGHARLGIAAAQLFPIARFRSGGFLI
jgi:hypothetical protein